MGAQLHGMQRQLALAVGVIGRIQTIEVGRHGGLGVHHEVSAPRQADDDVGPQPAVGAFEGLLGGEIAVGVEARHFEHVAERLLPPAAPGLRGGAQRVDEVRRHGVHRRLSLRHHLEPGGECPVVPGS